jgi:hypothetical protein
MITHKEARRLAAERIGEARLSPHGFTPLIIDDSTRETEFGWIFFYNAKEYLETGDFRFCLAGNAPLFVAKHDGAIYVTGTARPVEQYVEEIERHERTRTTSVP